MSRNTSMAKHWYTIKRKDDQPFTVAGIYDDAVINGNKVRSFQC